MLGVTASVWLSVDSICCCMVRDFACVCWKSKLYCVLCDYPVSPSQNAIPNKCTRLMMVPSLVRRTDQMYLLVWWTSYFTLFMATNHLLRCCDALACCAHKLGEPFFISSVYFSTQENYCLMELSSHGESDHSSRWPCHFPNYNCIK